MKKLSQPGVHAIELSVVIPVFNGSATIGSLVERIHRVFDRHRFEIILVNDGSRDESEATCAAVAAANPDTVTFVHLARNFGEHNAVLAGLNHASGAHVGVLDDDGQNPPEELLRMLQELKAKNFDVVYGRYRVKRHGLFRNLGSWFADKMANLMLGKPRGLYLSSFKVMNRFTAGEVIKYRGPFPYIDGLIYRSTSNIGQIDVEHRERELGQSNYTFRKLVRVWMNMFLNFSILPLRVVAWLGLSFSLFSLIALVVIWIDKIRNEPNPTPGIRTVLCIVTFFGGLILLVLGMLGEYVGRLCLDHSGTPQFVVRYVKRPRRVGDLPTTDQADREGERPQSSIAVTPPSGNPAETLVEAFPVFDAVPQRAAMPRNDLSDSDF